MNEYELGNALRLAEHRGLLARDEAVRRLEAFAENWIAGRWQHSRIPTDDIVTEAGQLPAHHTVADGHRAFDILHVVHARPVRAKAFLSFDEDQLRLAKAAGLAVGP